MGVDSIETSASLLFKFAPPEKLIWTTRWATSSWNSFSISIFNYYYIPSLIFIHYHVPPFHLLKICAFHANFILMFRDMLLFILFIIDVCIIYQFIILIMYCFICDVMKYIFLIYFKNCVLQFPFYIEKGLTEIILYRAVLRLGLWNLWTYIQNYLSVMHACMCACVCVFICTHIHIFLSKFVVFF